MQNTLIASLFKEIAYYYNYSALQHGNQTKNNIYACLKNIKVSFISHLLTKNHRLF